MTKSTDTDTGLEIARLAGLDARALQALHRDLFGAEHAVANPGHLRRKIAWHLQARREGGLPESAIQYAEAIARDSQLRARIGLKAARRLKGIPVDQAVTSTISPDHQGRMPMPGALLVREFRGRTVVVKVLADGFEYDGRRFRSLTAIAQEVTGTKWNGRLFFGLTKENALAS